MMRTLFKPARGRGRRASAQGVLARCLLMLNRLKQGPARKAELIEAVRRDLPGAYPAAPAAQRQAFKRDLQRLRRIFGVALTYANGQYALSEPGPLLSLSLSPEALEGMMGLALAFEGQPDYANVLRFIEEVARWLPADQRLSLSNPQVIVNLDIVKQLDPDPIAPRVWESVRRAKAQRRLLQFNYLSARYEDNRARRFRVAPARIVYQWGHMYLLGYVLPQAGSTPATGEYIRFRLSGIQDDDALQVLPTVMGRTPASEPPRYEVRYRLLPPLGRGKVSRHFEEMEVIQREDGTAEVRGKTQDLFYAERVLLSYGQYCVVLGGPELLARMREAVEGMYRNLGAGEQVEGRKCDPGGGI
jgi:predicted DNA-binding transcriptional regulator YafY